MATEVVKLDSVLIADQLKLRKKLQHSTVLVLGSRSGGLFRSEMLYEMLEQYGDPSFGTGQRPSQFSQCHRILIRNGQFSVSEVDAILSRSLDKVTNSAADFCLAELIKLGLFDVIISTSVDTLFEQAFGVVGMSELRDFEIFRPASDPHRDVSPPEKRTSCQVIKVFGELAREYTIKRAGYVLYRPQLAGFLRQKLAGDILAIGLDPVWDAELCQLISPQGGTFWFINEEPVGEASVLYPVIEERSKKGVLVGDDGSYERFVTALYWEFVQAILPFNYWLAPNIINSQHNAVLFEIRNLSNEIKILQDIIRGSELPVFGKPTK